MLGALSFEFVPKAIDSTGLWHTASLGNSPILVSFLIFINTHHYFIDNVIWRSNNEQIKKYLFATPADAKPSANLRRVA
jgi:hypothetical protein